MFAHTPPEWLFYLALPIVAFILIVGWLLYASRGGRAVTLNFKGFGIQVDINTSLPDHKLNRHVWDDSNRSDQSNPKR